MSSKQFVHLNAHSSFSLLTGMISVGDLAKTAANMNMPALGVTDVQNMFGGVQVSQKLPKEGVQPILGCQLNVQLNETPNQDLALLTLLVQNREGYLNLCDLISDAYIHEPEGALPQVPLQRILDQNNGLIALSGDVRDGVLSQALKSHDEDTARSVMQQLAQSYDDRFYVEVQRHSWTAEAQAEPLLLGLANELSLPAVATNDARFLNKEHHEAFEALVCIGESATVDTPNRKQFTEEHYFKSPEEMHELFTDQPEALQNTVEIAKRCGYWLEYVGPKDMFMPQWTPETGTVEEELRRLSAEGLEKRMQEAVLLPEHTAEEEEVLRQQYQERLEMELEIIISMGFSGYFLITSDFILWSKENNIPVGPGRGSGAGSLVAWCLEITDLDPIPWGLYFERFLNPDRISLPDFDIDFCQDRRDEVIRYVRDKYGAESVSQIITFGTLKARACIRDVGRVLQMPFGQVGQIAAFVPEVPNPPPIQEVLDDDERLQELYNNDEDVKRLIDIAMQLEGCYRHASTHAAGVMIADRPIREVCPLYKDPRSDIPATQFSMFDAEASGLVKFDFLGLKTLTVVKEAVDLVHEHDNADFDIRSIGWENDKSFELLQAGETIGVFQVESRGMTDFLKKIVPDRFQYLSDVIALYRPGPLGSGMADDFIECRHERKEAVYPHPALEPILKDTFGVPVYQEQVMRMAQEMADYSLGQADMLRRAMGKKKVDEMAKHREIFLKGSAEKHQVDADQANYIFDLMANFAGYGFNKAHTIAYALIAWQTAYLKANYPAHFIAGSLTLDRGNSDKVHRFVQDAKRMKIKVLAPDVNKSATKFTLEGGKIRFALTAIKGAGADAMATLVEERKENGKFKDLFDFLSRLGPKVLNKRQMEVLIKSGSLDSLHDNRAELLANLELLLGFVSSSFEDKNSNQIGLFGAATTQDEAASRPQLKPTEQWDSFTKLEREQEVFGFYLSAHPLESYKTTLKQRRDLVPLIQLSARAEKGQKTANVAALIQAKREVKTKSGNRMAILTLSDSSGSEEVAVFPEYYAQIQQEIKPNKPYLISLEMSVDGERLRINVKELNDLEKSLAPAEEKKLIIELAEFSHLENLKEILTAQEEGTISCRFAFTHNTLGRVEVRPVPKAMHLGQRALTQIQNLPGIQIQN
jgi:DNA polymerase-3 subunit alpha